MATNKKQYEDDILLNYSGSIYEYQIVIDDATHFSSTDSCTQLSAG